jgi:hypothetical protein
MTTALEGGEWSAARPDRFVRAGKTRYPLYRRLGGPQGRSGQVRKVSPPPGFFLQNCTFISRTSSTSGYQSAFLKDTWTGVLVVVYKKSYRCSPVLDSGEKGDPHLVGPVVEFFNLLAPEFYI